MSVVFVKVKKMNKSCVFQTLSFVILFLFSSISDGMTSQNDTSSQVNRVKKANRLSTPELSKKITKKPTLSSNKKIKSVTRPLQTNIRIHENNTAPDETIKDVPIKNALENFFNSLIKVVSGQSTEPVTILHLGDNHIARDQLSGPLREMLQTRFGDAGRGMVMPGPVFPFYKANGINFKSTGKWVTKNSMSKEGGPYGITGAAYTSVDVKSSIQMSTTGSPFSWVEVSFLTGPTKGRAIIWVESAKGSHQQIIETKARNYGIRRVRFPSEATSVSIFPENGRPITLLSWQTGHNRPGVRYVNLGFPDATAEIAQNLDAELVERDLKNLKPNLVVLNYGFLEGFNDQLDMALYEVRLTQLIQVLRSLIPDASFMIIGPPDAAYMPEYARNSGVASSQACRALSNFEIKNYKKLIRSKDPRLARWYPPVNLNRLRRVMRRVAAESGAYFWDWSTVMGGTCGIHAWVHNKPKLASDNHRNFTPDGARQSAHRLYSELMSGFDSYRLLAKK